MAQQALALGGAALGAWIGGPWGARIGFAVGTAAGALLFPEKSPKPQKADTTVQSGSYGTPIAVLAGTDRTAGTLIWVKENELQTKKVKTGGKGIGAVTGGTEAIEYFASFAVLIGEGPIDGIRKIWCDTKLEHDASGQALDDALYSGGQFVVHLHAIDANLRIYLGTDDQLPDPAIQADRGVAATPAFRGLTYIVFDELPLADFANRIPNISVEYVKDGHVIYRNLELTNSSGTGNSAGTQTTLDPYGPYLWTANSGGTVTKWDLTNGQVVIEQNVEGQLDSSGDSVQISNDGPVPDEFGNVYISGGTSSNASCYRFDAITLALTGHIEPQSSQGILRIFYRSYLSGSERWLFGTDAFGRLHVVDVAAFQQKATPLDLGSLTEVGMVDVVPGGTFYVAWTNGASSLVRKCTLAETPTGSLPYAITLAEDFDVTATHGGSLTKLVYYEDENCLLLGSDGVISKFDLTTEAITASMTGAGVDANEYEWKKGPVNGKLWGKLTGANGDFVEIDLAAMEVSRSLSPTLWSSSGGTKIAVGYTPWADALVALVASNQSARVLFLPRIDPLDVDRADVITQYSEEVGLTASQINVSGVTTTVKGNTVRRQTTGRDALEPILQVGFVEAADYDRKVNFIQLGQSPTLTISEDDLGARLEDRTGETQNLVETIEQEIRLPERILLRYPDRDAQYDPGAQSARRSRLAVTTREQITVDTSEVLDSDGGRQCVEKLLYSAWQERTHLRFSILPKYGKLVPTDVVNLTRGNVSYKVRLQKVDIGPYLECEGVPQEPATYVSTITGVPTNIPGEVLQIISDTQLFLIDSNMLRDEDDDGEHYLALAPNITDGIWTGAQIFTSSDGTNFASSTSFTTAVDWGVATTALADHHCTTTDRYNSLTVRMVRNEGTIASCTELEMLNGSNAFLLQSGDDWELIQAANITDNGNGNFTLSTLLRGVRGTEQAAGDHAVGDRLIVLDATTMQRLGVSSEIGLTRYYKAVTFGKNFNPTGAIPFANTARGRECYAPTYVRGTRNGSGDLTITWYRRSRIGGEADWGDAITDVPLGEDSEEYKVEIYNGATLVRTISDLASETTTYTAAQQVTDFGSAQSTVSIKVYQMSEDNGPGRAATATI
jgi:WD40 repeat protein